MLAKNTIRRICMGLISVSCGMLLATCNAPVTPANYTAESQRLEASGKLRTERLPPDVPFTVSDAIRNFSDIAFQYEFHFRDGAVVNERIEKPLKRWSGVVRYALIGDAVTDNDRSEITRLTSRLGDLTGLWFQPVEGDHDLLISIAASAGRDAVAGFLEQRGLPEYRRRYDLWRDQQSWTCGATVSAARADRNALVYAHVYLAGELPGIMRLSCLHEEIAQVLGLTNDSPAARPSIFNDDQEFATLTAHDELLLRALYDPRLRPGMTREQALPIARQIISELYAQ